MATIVFPTDGSIAVTRYSEGIEYDVEITIARAGRITTRMLPGARWCVDMVIAMSDRNGAVGRGAIEAILTSLRGGANALAMYNPRKPLPLGTLRGAPVVAVAAAIGATTVALNGATNGQTILRGDRFGLAGQRVMAVADAVVAAGAVNLTFEPALEAAVGIGTALVWDKPTSLFIPTEPKIMLPYTGQLGDEIPLSLVEL